MKLSAKNMKEMLWQTMQEVRSKKITPKAAQAVASQSREIIRIVRIELQVASMRGDKPRRVLTGKAS